MELRVSCEEEAEAALLCLKYAYTGTIPERLTVPQLLRALVLADLYAMEHFLDAVARALIPCDCHDCHDCHDEAMRVQDAVVIASTLSSLPGQASQVSHPSQGVISLVDACGRCLVAHMGDVVTMMRDEELLALWRSLPPMLVHNMLASSDFASDSEDSVLAAAQAWAEEHAADAMMALRGVRMVQLSHAYMNTVMPRVPLVRDMVRVGAEDLFALMGIANATDPKVRNELKRDLRSRKEITGLGWEDMTTCCPRRQVTNRIEVRIPRERIESPWLDEDGSLLSVLELQETKDTFACGMYITVLLQLVRGELKVGIVAMASSRPGSTPALVELNASAWVDEHPDLNCRGWLVGRCGETLMLDEPLMVDVDLDVDDRPRLRYVGDRLTLCIKLRTSPRMHACRRGNSFPRRQVSDYEDQDFDE